MDSINADEINPAQSLLECINDLVAVGKGGRVQLMEFAIDYPAGLHSLVMTLMLEIRDVPVLIDGIHYEFGELEIGFQMQKQVNELRVWRAVNKARKHSLSACQGCGTFARRKIVGDKVIILCSDCQKALDSKGKTGTWLDKY
jgi:hypothetical protein